FLLRRRPHLAYALWLVVLFKCVTPPFWSSPSGIFCWVQRTESVSSGSTPSSTAPIDSHSDTDNDKDRVVVQMPKITPPFTAANAIATSAQNKVSPSQTQELTRFVFSAAAVVSWCGAAW